MLFNLGEKFAEHYREISWKTSRREIRSQLLSLLSKKYKFTEEQLNVIGTQIYVTIT